MLKKPMSWFIFSYAMFQLVLFLMRGENNVFWLVITGIMLIASVFYVYYERHIDSKNLQQSLMTALATSLCIVVLHSVLSVMLPYVQFDYLVNVLPTLGIYFKVQLFVSLFLLIPLHELYFRGYLQSRLMDHYLPYVAIIVTALASSLLFVWTFQPSVVIFFFFVQLILGYSFTLTKRLMTPIVAEILAIILLLMIHGR